MRKCSPTKEPKLTVELEDHLVRTVNIFSEFSFSQDEGLYAEVRIIDGVVSDISIWEKYSSSVKTMVVVAKSYHTDALLVLFEKIIEQVQKAKEEK